MTSHPNEYLNEFVAYYVLQYLQKINFDYTGSPINKAAWNFLERANVDPSTRPNNLSGHLIAFEAAQLQKWQLLYGQGNTSLRSVIRSSPHLMPLVAHGPQALLIHSYLPLLLNLYELDLGLKKYGYGYEVYRRIEDNVRAARMMFENASLRVSDKLFQLYYSTPDLALFEGGAGNGAAMFTNLQRFGQAGLFPQFLLSDIDRKTLATANEYFQNNGFNGQVPWIQVDLGSENDLLKVEKALRGYTVIVNINFIIHEHSSIADAFFTAMRSSLPGAKLVISEFFLPENVTINPQIPSWFIFLHGASGQCLRTESDFVTIAESHGYNFFDRLDHQIVDNQPLVSTLFLEK